MKDFNPLIVTRGDGVPLADQRAALEEFKRQCSRIHDLKCWPGQFFAVVRGYKTFECRLNDRDFRVGDTLRLREWDPFTKEYSGQEVRRLVTFILHGPAFGIEPEHVVMALGVRMPPAEARPAGWGDKGQCVNPWPPSGPRPPR